MLVILRCTPKVSARAFGVHYIPYGIFELGSVKSNLFVSPRDSLSILWVISQTAIWLSSPLHVSKALPLKMLIQRHKSSCTDAERVNANQTMLFCAWAQRDFGKWPRWHNQPARVHEICDGGMNSERTSKIVNFWSSCVIDSKVMFEKLRLRYKIKTYIQRVRLKYRFRNDSYSSGNGHLIRVIDLNL